MFSERAVTIEAKRALRVLRADLSLGSAFAGPPEVKPSGGRVGVLARSGFRRSPAKQALRGRKLGFAPVLTNCHANTRGNSGNNWRVRHTISRPFFFAAVGVSRARLARLAKTGASKSGRSSVIAIVQAGVESDFRSLRFNGMPME